MKPPNTSAWTRTSARGATAVEYSLIALAIAAVIIGVLTFLGPDVVTLYQSVDW
ncbi:Flp family type IVb pilin [Nocardioides sp. SYSU DS0651]|uniref:Flp family type IVb pilin n=1 Tax=Nocardioides sp. SYSU DS0651 TaxID=3415955 RepID=UPI003F4BEB79